jgi:hypothetical protein
MQGRGELVVALSCLSTMTDLDNVQEVDERKRTGMEKMSVDEELFEQSL